MGARPVLQAGNAPMGERFPLVAKNWLSRMCGSQSTAKLLFMWANNSGRAKGSPRGSRIPVVANINLILKKCEPAVRQDT